MQVKDSCPIARVFSQPPSVRRSVRVSFDGAQVVAVPEGNQLSWSAMAKKLQVGATIFRRAYQDAKESGNGAGQNLESGRGPGERAIREEIV